MEEATTESVTRAKSSRRQLNNKLSQSIEAHRLRLLKARGSKNVKSGRLCECQKCDVTSMKPSMMCLKNESRTSKKEGSSNGNSNGDKDVKKAPRPSKIPQVDSVRSRRRPHDVADVPILTSVVSPMPSASNHVNKTEQLREVEAPVDTMETLVQQRSFAEYCEAFGIKDGVAAVTRSGSGSHSSRTSGRTASKCESVSNAVSRLSEYEGMSDRNLKQKSVLDEINSTRLSSSRTLSSRFGQKGNLNPANVEDEQVKALSRRINSIHLVDSQGGEHRVDMADISGKMLSVVNEVVNGSGSRNLGVDVIPSLELNGMERQQELENSGSNKQKLVDMDADIMVANESIDKYRNVVDVLLDYIATGRSERSRSAVDVPRHPVKSMEHGDSSGCSQVPSEEQTTVEDRDDVYCCSAGGKLCLWCNTMEKESTFVGQQKDNGNAKLPGMTYVTPSRVVSSVIGRPQPMNANAFVKTQPNMGNHMVYMQQPQPPTMPMMMPPQFLGPYRFQPPSRPTTRYSYTPSLCPTMNCCLVQNVRMPSVAPVMPQQMSRHVFTPVSRTPSASRRRYTPAPSQRSISTQQPYVAMLTPMGVPRMYTGSMPRTFTGQLPVNTTAMQSPLGHMPKQGTRPLYRRNTGRAYVKRVQAAMV